LKKMNFGLQRFSQILSVRLSLLGLALGMGFGDCMATLGRAPSNPVGQAPVLAEPSRLPTSSPSSSTSSSASAPAVPAAKLQVTARPGAYTVHESVLDSGTTVTELATPAGVVFAVTWRGPVLPDLNVLLGDYFQAFRAEAQQARAAGRRGSPVTLDSAALVIRSSGRMRNFFGSAYAPGLVPADVNVKDALQ
jgi:Protein of unknown function (DUF2844)